MLSAFPGRVVILGGGAAGWLTAAYLDRTYNTPARRVMDITVVESQTTPRIGVGEATVPMLKETLRYLGVNEADFVARTSATLKHGVLFEDWSRVGESYFHPFEAVFNATSSVAPALWMQRRLQGVAGRYAEESSVQTRVAAAGFSPKRVMDDEFLGPLPYAYHLDAELFADLLCALALERGCRKLAAHVVDVEHSEDGDIAALVTSDGLRVAGDFFIDCSGFASRLLGQALGTPFESYGDHLLCDRAVALRVPTSTQTATPPFTRATALDFGWRWRIALRRREGLGYVYSSEHISPDDAETALRRSAGVPDDIPARHLVMRVGSHTESWVRNCLAVGLASGFIEPLESTGLMFIEMAMRLFVRNFPLSGENGAARRAFNREMALHYRELRDFIVLHYCLTKRDDTAFWREVQKPERIPDSLKERLELWRDRMPVREDFPRSVQVFGPASWQMVMYGMELTPRAAMDNAAFWVPPSDNHLRYLADGFASLQDLLPAHDIWLESVAPLADCA